MAATRFDIPQIDHLNYFATFSRYPLMNRERITQRFYELFPLSPAERAKLEKELYQDIQSAALYLMFTAVEHLGTELRLIWPKLPLPTAVAFRHERDALVANLEEHIIFSALHKDIVACQHVDSSERITQYAYLYKEMHCIYRYTEILLRYLDSKAKLNDLQKCIADNEPTWRITEETAQRIIRASQAQNKKLKLLQKTKHSAPDFQLPPNIFNEWFQHEHFTLDDQCEVEDMTPLQRVNMKLTLLFLQKFLDEVSTNAFSQRSEKLAEKLKHCDVVQGYLTPSKNGAINIIAFIADTDEKRAQETQLRQFLKLDVIALSVSKILGMPNRLEGFRQLMCIFQNTVELLTFFDQELEKYMTVRDNGNIYFAHVPEGVINSQREADEVFRNLYKNRDEYLDEDIFVKLWALNCETLITPTPAVKKTQPVKPRTQIKTAVLATVNNKTPDVAQPAKEDHKTTSQPEEKDEKKSQEPSPQQMIATSVIQRHEKLLTHFAAADLELKALQQEYRKLYREHAADFSQKTLTAWAQKVDQFVGVLEQIDDTLSTFQLPDTLYNLQNALIDFNRQQDKITVATTQIKTFKRELTKELAPLLQPLKAGTLAIQQKLADKQSAKKAKQDRTSPLTPAMSPSGSPVTLAMSPARSPLIPAMNPPTRSPLTRANSEVAIQSPEQLTQAARRSSMSVFSLFDNRGNTTPTSASSNPLTSPRHGG